MGDRMRAPCWAAMTVSLLTPASHTSIFGVSWLPFLRDVSCGLAVRLLNAR